MPPNDSIWLWVRETDSQMSPIWSISCLYGLRVDNSGVKWGGGRERIIYVWADSVKTPSRQENMSALAAPATAVKIFEKKPVVIMNPSDQVTSYTCWDRGPDTSTTTTTTTHSGALEVRDWYKDTDRKAGTLRIYSRWDHYIMIDHFRAWKPPILILR